MKKKLTAVLGIVLALIFIAGDAPMAFAVTSESIQQKESELKRVEEEKNSLQSSLTDVKALKKKLEAQKSDLAQYVKELDAQLAAIQDRIAELTEQIVVKEAEIVETQAELDEARQQEEQQYNAMVYRIQSMYEMGDSSYLEMIFSGDTISDILNQIEYMEQVLAYDKEQLENYQRTCEYVALCEQELKLEKEMLDDAKAGVEAEEAAVEELIEDKKQTIAEYESDINNKAKAIREYEAEINEQNEVIEALEAAILEEKKQILAQNGQLITYDGGQFKFPLATYTRLSDDYGMRMHPTLGVQKFHNGIDLASPSGTDIYAAYDGKVAAASYSSSMGNYVMINHGDGLYTIYMHASKLYVTAGDIVARGETIAAVGSTGRSTGPHLHFGVRLNGEYVSPWNYLKL